MKVLDLRCAQGHGFEGWFASEDDFQRQTGSGLLTCPLCGDAQITRLLSAPRLNLHGGEAADVDAQTRPLTSAAPATESAAAGIPVELQAAWLRMVRQVLAHTENVGPRFAEEARRIHYGEAPGRGIRGQASPDETRALLAEGIAVLPLPIPDGMDGPVQ